MPQVSYFFDFGKDKDSAKSEALEYTKSFGFTPISVDFKFTGAFITDSHGLIISD